MWKPLLRAGLVTAMLGAGFGTSEAQELSPETLDALRRGAEVRELPAEGVRVPLLGPRELPLVEVTINGEGPFRFLVDLGSNVVIVRRAAADAAGMDVVVEREGTDIVHAAVVRMGGAVFRNVVMGAYEELDVDGVLGYNILRGNGLALDYPERVLEMGAGAFAQDAPSMEYEVESRMPYLPARVGERRIPLNLDTGAANWIVFPEAWTSWLPLAGPPVDGPVLFNNQTGAVRNRIAQLAVDLVVGPHVIRRPVVFLDPEVEDAWLGSAILADSRVELDTRAQRVRIDARSELHSPAFRTLGISLDPAIEGRPFRRLDDVIPGTPAAALPLSVGDTVLRIGDVEAADVSSSVLRRLAAGADAVTLILLRGGDTVAVSVPVAELGTHEEVTGADLAGIHGGGARRGRSPAPSANSLLRSRTPCVPPLPLLSLSRRPTVARAATPTPRMEVRWQEPFPDQALPFSDTARPWPGSRPSWTISVC